MIRTLIGLLYGKPGQERSPHWKKVRSAHLVRESECQACGGKTLLEAHHIIPVHVDRRLELDPNNLITLCDMPGRMCHLYIGHRGVWEDYDENVRYRANRLRAERREERGELP